MLSAPLPILYADEEIVAVNKPHGIAVHASGMYKDDKEFVLQTLRNQLGQKVYPAHRLDKKTSGVLLFALTEDMNRKLQNAFSENHMHKTYHALVRGHLPAEGTIDYPLINNEDKRQEAITHYRLLQHFEIAVPLGKYPTSRYSLAELQPDTGRYHQLRKHMAHIFHPIIGDRPHGCNKQNKLWKETFHHDTMMLHARKLQFTHPTTQMPIFLEAPYTPQFEQGLAIVRQAT
jgi:tRNA pseudouridine65 synthase